MPDIRALPHPPTLSATGGDGFDTLVVGAGFAGCVLAERLASQNGQRVLLIDKRPHIGGNAYDRYDDVGVLVHPYGPHLFHTHSADVFAYLSQFTAWRPYQHRVPASVDGQRLPMPINLDTVNHPNDHAYTRVTECRHLTGQAHAQTSLVYEHPRADGDPYYPVPRRENATLLRRYEADTEQRPHVTFVGRLASYQYYNLDQVVGQALATHKRLAGALAVPVAAGRARRPDPEVRAGLGVSAAGLERRSAAPIPVAKPPRSALTVSTKKSPKTPLFSRSHQDA